VCVISLPLFWLLFAFVVGLLGVLILRRER
jgi:hypothetical protein